MGDNHALEITGTIYTIQKIWHVKGLKINLLSLGQLDSSGCKTHIQDGIIKIDKGALMVMNAEKIVANLYMLKGEAQ